MLAGCAQNNAPPANGAITPPLDDGTTPPSGETKTIEITASAFVPNTLTIKSGDTVKFINTDAETHWPASDPHPTHQNYPETGGCISSKFDACNGIGKGETYSFTFNEKGTWGYHDHLNPALKGTITVE